MKTDPETLEDRTNDVLEMMQAVLGYQVDRLKARNFARAQAQFQGHQQDLGRRALAHQISRKVYVAELNEAMQHLAHEGENLFGADEFHKVFGRFRADNLFDTQAFIAEDQVPPAKA